MKPLLIALAVLNVLLLAIGLMGRSNHSGTGAPSPELNPDRIKVIAPGEATERLRRSDPRGDGSSGAGSPNIARACIEWGFFTTTEALRVEQMLAAASQRSIERRGNGPPMWWVLIAPQINRRAADAVGEFLQRNGITDFYIVTDEPKFANAVSLGLFSTASAANTRRTQLTRLGLRDVLVQEREPNAGLMMLRLRDVSADTLARVTALRSDFPAAAVRDCGS